MYELRPYQIKAKDSVLKEWRRGNRKTLLVLPTGTGKTIVFSSIVENQIMSGKRSLIIAHRGELLDQAREKLETACGINSSLEKAEKSCLGSSELAVVGSVQTLSNQKRLDMFPRDYFSTIVVDEAHHCLSESYKRVLDHFDKANILGVTATPDRGDQKNLGTYFDSKAYEYSMRDAIKDGYLCPVKAQLIPLKLDICSVGMSNGDFSVGEIGSAIDPYLEKIVEEMTDYCKGRKTVVFLPLIATSQKFCEMLNRAGLKSEEVNGKSENRSDILKRFENGDFDVLCNSMLLTEGWDCPSVDCIVVLRPTKVRSLYQQMIGRGMRLSPGKEDLLVLDFLWMTNRHDLCRPSSIVAKDENISSKMDKIIESGEELDVLEVEKEAEKNVLAEREEALRKTLEEQRKKKKKLVDPLQYAMSIAAEDLVDYVPTFMWEMEPATEKQIRMIENFGISAELIENKGHASLIIDKLSRRREEGLATPKQIRKLEQKGFINVGTWDFESARNMIGRIASNGWRLPRGVNPSLYDPR